MNTETIVVISVSIVIVFLLLFWLLLRYYWQVYPPQCVATIHTSGSVAAGDKITVMVAFYGKMGNSLHAQRFASKTRAFTLKMYQEDFGGSFTHIRTSPLYCISTENNVGYFRWIPEIAFQEAVHVVVCYKNIWIGGKGLPEIRVDPSQTSYRAPLIESDILGIPDNPGELSRHSTPLSRSSPFRQIQVTHGPLERLVYAQNDMLDMTCYQNETCHFDIKGIDKFGNTILLDPQQWFLEGQNQYGSVVEVTWTAATTSSALLQFLYVFEKYGVYTVIIRSRDQNNKVVLPSTLTVWVNENFNDHDETYWVPYSKNDYIKAVYPYKVITIRGFSIPKLLGEGCTHLENINRVLASDKRLTPGDVKMEPNTGNDSNSIVLIDVSSFHEQQRRLIHKLLSTLVRSIHYRKEAYKLNKKRINWKDRATKEYNRGNHRACQEAKMTKERCSMLMDKVHSLASGSAFIFFNFYRTVREIDLHGQLVEDDNKLNDFWHQQLEKYNEFEVEEMVNRGHFKMDEALHYLITRNVTKVQDGRDWLEIIVGAGHHSKDNRPKIKPKVEQLLIKSNVDYQECNKGSLLITYKEYCGKEPCFGSFYCQKCCKSWESSASWKRYWQKCFKCESQGVDSFCYPMKLSPTPTTPRRGANNRHEGKSNTSHRQLCQKCLETGKDCRFS